MPTNDYRRDFYERMSNGEAAWVVENLISAYKRAGDVLVDRALEGTESWESLVFPTLFLYRQHLELALKACSPVVRAYQRQTEALTGAPFDDVAWVNPITNRHDLDKAWQAIRPLLYSPDLALDADLTERAEAVIEWFHSIDKGSFVFRYPEEVDHHGIDLSDLSPEGIRDDVATASIAIDGLRQWLLVLIEEGRSILSDQKRTPTDD